MLTRIATLVFFVAVSQLAISQDFSTIDAHSRKAPSSVSKSVESLAEYLNEGTTTDLEKVRAYYVWLTFFIDYDTHTFFSSNPNPKVSAEETLSRKRAICQGYAELFEALCKASKIESFVIAGYSKGYGYKPGKTLTEANHAWNSVKINNRWYLLDATWGAGSINDKQRFTQHFEEKYFLTNPKNFIHDHMPVDPMWQLLYCPITIDDFTGTNEGIISKLKHSTDTCFYYNDTIALYEKLSPIDQEVNSAERSFRFNPNNMEIPGFAYLSLAYDLSLKLADLYNTKQYDKALELNKLVLSYNQKAYDFLRRSRSDQGKNAASICKQNMETMKTNIKSLERSLK